MCYIIVTGTWNMIDYVTNLKNSYLNLVRLHHVFQRNILETKHPRSNIAQNTNFRTENLRKTQNLLIFHGNLCYYRLQIKDFQSILWILHIHFYIINEVGSIEATVILFLFWFVSKTIDFDNSVPLFSTNYILRPQVYSFVVHYLFWKHPLWYMNFLLSASKFEEQVSTTNSKVINSLCAL